ncbi:hypothetical protein NQ317_007328 [Molorchus minor]|uniref:Odorant receptor n=1 Tax=Molorchus minor TaxID=1323400 RepID=A0ABQ9JAT7_9CUCU|nr:hypothetical protein NQ317_007328 [Molorchus minor]
MHTYSDRRCALLVTYRPRHWILHRPAWSVATRGIDDMAEGSSGKWNVPQLEFKEIVGTNVRFLYVFGNIIPEFRTKGQTVWYLVYAVTFVGSIYVSMLTSEVINMVVVMGDLEKMTEASFLALTHMIQVGKLYYIYKYRNRLGSLIKSIDRYEFRPRSIYQYNTLKEYIRDSKRITNTFLSACVVTCAFWSLYPFTVEEELRLPLAGWYPFDTSKSPAFEITFVYQAVASTINGLSNICLDTLMSGLIMVVCAQFNILNDSLKNLREYSKDELDVNARFRKEMSVELQNKMDEKLWECVVHHRYILEYAFQFASEVTFLFTYSILGQFIVSVIIICITLFEITLLPWGSLKFFSLILYQLCMLLEIFLLCYYGNKVIVESMELTKCAYHDDWIDCSTKFKRNLLFFMTRSQVPLKLTAGGFFTLSLDTFVKASLHIGTSYGSHLTCLPFQILKSSYSYFAVLNRVHSKKI